MIRRLSTAFIAATIPLLVEAIAPAAAATPCDSLAALTIPTVTIRSATAIAAGPFTPSPSSMGAPMTLPAFCRVEATARPTADS